ncbi:unnamed protein product [Adineta ricciae]|uniref:Protein GUCD1 n=1 Tax=Adineta ricciae TaxID=249248 RepID=A0A815DJA5_ADIRI|nr:unnamed protein product [Adineta ricciae]
MNLVLPVKHFKQNSNWDCGVVCLQMIIDYYHCDRSKFKTLLDNYECNHSTWTIDLLHLLHQSDIPAILHTITIGCSQSYDNVPYYEKLIDKDRRRVDQLFKDEAANVKLGGLPWSELKEHLVKYRTPCLVLIDANQLQCCTCQRTTWTRLVDKLLPMISSSYQGHYVLLIGFIEDETNEFIRYADPGKTDGFCTTTRENFDQARRAFGTDEDLILCYEKQ